MNFVFNNTALVALAGIDLIESLPRLGDEFSCPVAVKEEFGRGPGTRELPRWLRVEAVSYEQVNRFPALLRLGAGEREAVALAETKGGVFVSDDRVARSVAEGLGVRITGTLGILARLFQSCAFEHDVLGQHVRALRYMGLLHLSDRLEAEILRVQKAPSIL